jgi:hypothetical protein
MSDPAAIEPNRPPWMIVVAIMNCRKESTGGNPGSEIDLSRAAEFKAKKISGNVSDGTIAIG